MRTMLKKYKENNYSSEVAWNYAVELESKGWINDMLEGGVISPDTSTIFYYSRTPYTGQLLKFKPNKNEQYDKIVKELENDFMEVE